MQVKYYSQYGQDKLLHNLFFKGKKKGVFLDIGAHDGVSFSNTYFFERYLGWKGICIEPNPEVFQRLKKNRTCTNLNLCVHNKEGMVTFTRIKGYGEMLSGISNQYDPRHAQRINETIQKYGGEREEIPVRSSTPLAIIHEYKLDHIDLMNIDTEGNEWPILESFPFDEVQPQIVLVENNYKDDQIRTFLASKGYRWLLNQGDDVFHFGELSLYERWNLFLFKARRSLRFRWKKLTGN